MKPLTIHIPMLRKKDMPEQMNTFYEDVLGYERDAELGVLRVPGHANLAVCFKYADRGETRSGALYEFSLEKNFPSFCARLKDKGVAFDMLARTPGFYFARFLDPSGNFIEVISENFEDEAGVDVSGWSGYQDMD
jgi:catechol 2,3-dioxygenase-like lactoylglutathione lyase family enzyme